MIIQYLHVKIDTSTMITTSSLPLHFALISKYLDVQIFTLILGFGANLMIILRTSTQRPFNLQIVRFEL